MKQDINGNLGQPGVLAKPVPGVYLRGLLEFQTQVAWVNVIFFLLLHLAAVYGFLIVVVDMEIRMHLYSYFVAWLGGEGVTIGAHRLWTHRSFKAKTPLKIVLVIMQTFAGENCVYTWARDHRQHHKYSDTDADPHNAKRGLFFSHMGWLMMKKHPEVIRKGGGIDMSDLEADPVVMFQKKHFKKMYLVFGILVPWIIPYYFWGQSLRNLFLIGLCLRHVMLYHVTWTVNSLAHVYGYRPYDKNIKPRENWLVSLIAYGEGWHNYHHVFPWDYKASEYGKYLNATRIFIEWFERMGWAYDLREASHDMMMRRVHRSGSHSSFAKAVRDEMSKEEQEKGW